MPRHASSPLRSIGCALAVLAIAAGAARAASVFPVCVVHGDQRDLIAIADGEGGFYAAWKDGRNGSDADVYVTRMKGDGELAGGWPPNGLRVAADIVPEAWPRLALDAQGGVIVAWGATAYQFRVQRVSGAGVAQWAEGGIVLSTIRTPLWDASFTSLAPDGAGGVYAAWVSAPDGRAMLTRVNADGSRPGTFTPLLDVSGGVGFTRSLALAPDGLGGVFVLRNARPPGGPGVDLFVRHFTPFATVYPETEPWGTRVGAALGDADEVRVSPDGEGGVLAVWDDTRSGDADLYMTRLDAFGGTRPGWPDSGLAVCVAPGQQLKPRLASTDGGGWIVTWTDRRFGHDDVRAARLDRFGAPLPGWPSGGLEVAGGTGQQSAPDLAVLADGTALAAWVEDKPSGAAEVRAMRLSPDGHASPGPPGAPVTSAHVSAQADPVVVMRPDGRAWVLWRDLVEPNVADVLGTVLDVPLPLDTGPAPVRRSFALHGARPNPASARAVRVAFTLPDAAPARLELFDAAGRRLAARDVGAFGAGAHAVTFEPDAPLAPGIVLVRLARGGDVRTARVGVVR